MSTIFFVSSAGDTNLAKATIQELVKQGVKDQIFLVPITSVADDRTKDLIGSDKIIRIPLNELLKQKEMPLKKISDKDLEEISSFIEINNIQRAFIGVPSPLDEEIPFQIARALKIFRTVSNEHMFKPLPEHCLWSHINDLASEERCNFAVPLDAAKQDILNINPKAKVHIVGHTSIDPTAKVDIDIDQIRKLLNVADGKELVFVSATTQPQEVDQKFLDALLSEIATGQYPHLQLRFGIHPSIKEKDAYLQMLLDTCKKYPETHDQFKIILSPKIEEDLKQPFDESNFILRVNVSGPQASQAANKVTQAVTGELLVKESFFRGKPVYFHEKVTSYLPESWVSKSLPLFFNAAPQSPHSPEELGLEKEGTVASRMTDLMMR